MFCKKNLECFRIVFKMAWLMRTIPMEVLVHYGRPNWHLLSLDTTTHRKYLSYMLMFASAQITMDYRDQRSAITPLTMSLTLLMTLTLLVMPSGVWSQSAGSFDQALNRPITASVTCGTGNDITYEMYYSHSEIFLSSVDRVNKVRRGNEGYRKILISHVHGRGG